MRIYLIRHGESFANINQIFSNRGVKHPLTINGMEQVRNKLQELGQIKFSAVYSSPLVRAIQAATMIANSQRLNVQIAESLREYDVGVFEGTSSKTGEQGALLHQNLVDTWKAGNENAKLPGGESLAEIEYRLFSFIEMVFKTLKEEDNTVCIGHGGLFGAVLPRIIHNLNYKISEEMPLGYLSTIILEKKDNTISCIEWCGQKLI